MKMTRKAFILICIVSVLFASGCNMFNKQQKNIAETEPSETNQEIAERDSSDGEVIKLYIPIIEETPEQHLFFHDLLKTAIKESNLNMELVARKAPQLRVKEDLSSGNLSIYWMVESKERDKTFTPIEVGLTNGLIGNRILFIKEGDQPLYDNVKTLEDFRNLQLIGGMGQEWFDVKVWEANNLLFKEEAGTWESIFKKIPLGRDYDYFSRGANEILTESKKYPDLAIEKRLILVYDRDFRFYLSKTGPNAGAEHKAALQNALNKAKSSGTIDRLVQKYWGNDLKALDFDNRTKIELITPE